MATIYSECKDRLVILLDILF